MRYWSTMFAVATLFSFACLASGQNVDALNVGPNGGYIRDHGSSRVIVFIHGLFSGPEAWRCDNDHFWPAMIASDHDSAFADTDIYVAAYPTPTKHGKMTISDLDSIIAGRLENDGVFTRHKQVFFVSHSLGGLLTQDLLLTYRDQDLYKKVGFIFLYGTPQEGSKLANLGKYFSSDPLLRELEAGDGNFILHEMDEKWMHSGFSSIPRYCAYETQAEGGFKVVDRNSATRGCQDEMAIAADHRHIVKPCTTRDDAYIDLRNKFAKSAEADKSTATSDSESKALTQQQYNFGGQNFQIGQLYQESIGRRLTDAQVHQITVGLSGSHGKLEIVYMLPVDKEMREFGAALRYAAHSAGWEEGATTMDTQRDQYITNDGGYRSRSMRNVPAGTHCIPDGSPTADKEAQRLLFTALQTAKIDCYSGEGFYPPIPGITIAIYVGSSIE